MKSKLNSMHKASIKMMYANGKSITAIAMTTGMSTRTIGRVLDEAGIARPIAQAKGDAYNALQILKKHGVTVEQLDFALSVATKVQDKPDLVKIRDQIVGLEESMYNSWLATVIHQREAKKHNVHVQTAMLNLQEKADRNERANKEGTS